MDAQTIINELKERGSDDIAHRGMFIAIDAKRLYFDGENWIVFLGYPHQCNYLYAGGDFWQAFAAFCGATKHGVRATEPDHDPNCYLCQENLTHGGHVRGG